MVLVGTVQHASSLEQRKAGGYICISKYVVQDYDGAGGYVGCRPVVGPERFVPLHYNSFCLLRCSWHCWGGIDLASLCLPILAYISVYIYIYIYITPKQSDPQQRIWGQHLHIFQINVHSPNFCIECGGPKACLAARPHSCQININTHIHIYYIYIFIFTYIYISTKPRDDFPNLSPKPRDDFPKLTQDRETIFPICLKNRETIFLICPKSREMIFQFVTKTERRISNWTPKPRDDFPKLPQECA